MTAPTLARTRILNRIVAALGHGDVYVVAPAGYGKSTLLRLLPGHRPAIALLALTPSDADLSQLQERLLPHLAHSRTIVLDDVQHLSGATEALDWLNEHRRSGRARWVICGRDIPSELQDVERSSATLRATDLAFGRNEAQALLAGRDEAFVTQWRDRLQGWPLALALLSRSSDGLDLSGGEASDDLFRYLADAIFGQLPGEVLHATRASALPRRFDDALLAALLDVRLEQAQALRQEIQRRALFLEATEPTGWFKYHDAVREFLVAQLDEAMHAALAEKLIARFEADGEPHLAIESALDAGLWERAAQVLNTHKRLFTHALGRFSSYQRWLSRLPDAVHAAWPMLTSNFVSGLSNRDQPDARLMPWVERAQSLIAQHREPNLIAEVKRDIAIVYLNQRHTQRAMEILFETVRLPITDTILRARVHGTLGTTLATRFELKAAGMMLDEAQKIVETVQSSATQALLFSLRHNRANLIDNCIGNFRRAADTIAINIALFSDKPANLDTCYVGLCNTHENLGDWGALEDDLAQIKRVTIAQESGTDGSQHDYTLSAKWEMFYWSALHLGRGEFNAAARMIDAYCAAVSDPEAVICGQWLRAWSARCQGRYADCVGYVDGEALSDDPAATFYRAAIGLERAAAAVLSGWANWLEPATAAISFHIRLRARHYLLRWRILFALDAHRQGDARWRKHAAFALQALDRDDYATLLIRREPELAERFWAQCVREGIALDQAVSALVRLKRSAALLMHLDAAHSAEAPARTAQLLRLIDALAAVGDERAIPVLAEMRSTDSDVRSALARALDRLEAAPPPTLAVTLLGEFGARRNGVPIDPDAWQRPGVRQLLQYFCVHRGERLRRERVLREVWPNTQGASALSAYRTAFSRLGGVLEPHLRSRAPQRYFSIDADADTICFDPQRALVQLDSEAFLDAITAAKRASPLTDAALDTLLAALGTWRPPLGQSRFADWALDTIERLNAAYVDGCVLAAEALLAHARPGDLAQAERWAEAATRTAPWHEAGWQALLRAVARQGRRGEALRLLTRATEILQRELGAPPSPELQALAQRLHDDAGI